MFAEGITTITTSVRDTEGLDIKKLTEQANKIKSLLQVADYKVPVQLISYLLTFNHLHFLARYFDLLFFEDAVVKP